MPRVHRDAHDAVDLRPPHDGEAKFLEHDRERNLQNLNGKHCADARAWPGTERHVFILCRIDLAPAIGAKEFRFRVNVRQVVGEKMAANYTRPMVERQ